MTKSDGDKLREAVAGKTLLKSTAEELEREIDEHLAEEKPSIRELEAMIDREGSSVLEILPNGDIVRRRSRESGNVEIKPITFRQNLGGEYAARL